jgi:hypothetical protein
MTAQPTVIAPATQSEFATRKTGNSRSGRASDKERPLAGKSSLNGLVSLQYEPAMNAQKPAKATHKLMRRTRLRQSRVERTDGATVVILGSFSFTQMERVWTNRPQLIRFAEDRVGNGSFNRSSHLALFLARAPCRPINIGKRRANIAFDAIVLRPFVAVSRSAIHFQPSSKE